MNSDYTKAPRIFGPYELNIGTQIPLNDEHCHYLLSVMRRENGDIIRIFNGKDGEFIAKIIKNSKKSAMIDIISQIKPQNDKNNRTSLYFAPIKKDRLSFLIEKSVELGVTDLYPVLTDHTENRKFNPDKIEKQIIEAAEQCERLTIPTLHDAQTLHEFIQSGAHAYCGLERAEVTAFNPQPADNYACLIGPEGGWSKEEANILNRTNTITRVSLGDTILRAETAAIYMLARLPR